MFDVLERHMLRGRRLSGLSGFCVLGWLGGSSVFNECCGPLGFSSGHVQRCERLGEPQQLTSKDYPPGRTGFAFHDRLTRHSRQASQVRGW